MKRLLTPDATGGSAAPQPFDLSASLKTTLGLPAEATDENIAELVTVMKSQIVDLQQQLQANRQP